MFVCLCTGVTSATVAELAAGGALSSRQIAEACGAGSDCGRCRFTVRAIIEAATLAAATGSPTACPLHSGVTPTGAPSGAAGSGVSVLTAPSVTAPPLTGSPIAAPGNATV